MERVVLITGASSGIGAATAIALAASHQVVLVARRRERLTELVARIAAQGGRAHAIVADLADAAAPARVVAEAVAQAGRLDALVNNAGRFAIVGSDALTAAHLDEQWALNLRAPMLLAQAALPYLAARPGGWIVNISSVAAEATFTGCGAYSATKAGLECWSRILREELRPRGVRVGVVAPGATDSEVWPAGSTFDRRRMCRPEDVAAAIRFMLGQPATASVDRLVVTPPGGAL